MHQTKVPIWNLDIYGMTCYKSEHSSNQAQKAAQAPKHVVRNDVSKASVDTGTTQALWHHALLLHEKARLGLLRRMPQGRLSATVGRARKTKARQWRDLGDISSRNDRPCASLSRPTVISIFEDALNGAAKAGEQLRRYLVVFAQRPDPVQDVILKAIDLYTPIFQVGDPVLPNSELC